MFFAAWYPFRGWFKGKPKDKRYPFPLNFEMYPQGFERDETCDDVLSFGRTAADESLRLKQLLFTGFCFVTLNKFGHKGFSSSVLVFRFMFVQFNAGEKHHTGRLSTVFLAIFHKLKPGCRKIPDPCWGAHLRGDIVKTLGCLGRIARVVNPDLCILEPIMKI